MTTPTEPGIEGLLPDDGSLRATPCAPGSAVDAWRSIETAPKDGTTVDLWATGYGRKSDMCWTSITYPGGMLDAVGWTDNFYGYGRLYDQKQFTHWMPLPPSPSPQQALSGGAERSDCETSSNDLLLLAVEALEDIATHGRGVQGIAGARAVASAALLKINEARA